MSEICQKCAREGGKIYQCSKCKVQLCMHTIASHKCAPTGPGKPKPTQNHGGSITKEAWQDRVKRKKKFQVRIQKDLTIFIDFPWYPFTLLNAWIPSRRSNYKIEFSQSLNIEEQYSSLEKETNQIQYERKFYYRPWVPEYFSVWQIRWKKSHNDYWKRKSNQRQTRFILEFPQLWKEDVKILESNGCKVIFEPGAKEILQIQIKKALETFTVDVETSISHFRVSWSDKINQWFHSFFTVFSKYMAIREEDDINADYIPCITQVGQQEIEIPYWAAFRANNFWGEIKRALQKMTIPIFQLNYQSFKPTRDQQWDFPIVQGYELRSYQSEAIKKWIGNQFFGTVELPTGSGKTLIGIEAIRETHARSLVLVPNLALVDQWGLEINKKLGIPIEQIGFFNGQKKDFRNHAVVISTYQLLSQYLQDFQAFVDSIETPESEDKSTTPTRDRLLVEDTIGFFSSKFGLLIGDESHHIQAETFRFIAMNLEIPRRLALSATIEAGHHSTLVISTMGPIIFGVGYGRLAREGFISPIAYKRILIPLTKEEKEHIRTKGKGASVKAKISRESKNKLIAIINIVKASFTNHTLIYTSRINHANSIQSFLKDNKIDSTVLTGETVTNNTKLEEILSNFRSGKIRTLILVKMLNEGFDVGSVDTVIIASGTSNKREQIQRFGRATRPGKVAKLFELVIDPDDLEYEFEVSKERDITDIIEPGVQDMLLPIKEKREIESFIKSLKKHYIA